MRIELTQSAWKAEGLPLTYTRMSVAEELNWVEQLELTEQQRLIADRILKEIRARLNYGSKIVKKELRTLICNEDKNIWPQ